MDWRVTDYADFGKIMCEEVIVCGMIGKIRNLDDEFEAEFESKEEPFYLIKTFRSKKSAKDWCERMIRKYV